MNPKTFDQILESIQQAKNILLTIHRGQDGDALGSITAMIDLLEKHNTNYCAFLHEQIKKDFNFLPRLDKTQTEIQKNQIFDLALILDCGSYHMSDPQSYEKHINESTEIINIDHHSSNDMFGDINYVNNQASSTAEILIDFFQHIDHKIDKQTATSLLCGIACDTEMFNNAATNEHVIKQSSDLLKLGGDMKIITKKIFQNTNLKYAKFLGTLLKKVQHNKSLNLVSLVVTQDDIEKSGLKEEEIYGIANFLKNTNEGEIVLLLQEGKDGDIKGSLRSKHINIEPFAKLLGGGGHNKASGFTIEGNISQDSQGKYIID
jgi:bifunctional oligoribonuclease and PAP phosphatase NrnA